MCELEFARDLAVWFRLQVSRDPEFELSVKALDGGSASVADGLGPKFLLAWASPQGCLSVLTAWQLAASQVGYPVECKRETKVSSYPRVDSLRAVISPVLVTQVSPIRHGRGGTLQGHNAKT